MRDATGSQRGSLAIEVLLFSGVLGLPDGALGVLWPALRAAFRRPVGDLGLLLLVGALPYVVGGSSTGWAFRRLGSAVFIGGASAVAAATLLTWAIAPAWGLVIAAAGLLGLARGAIDGGVNAEVALRGSRRRLGLLHASYGLGATLGPLLVVALVSRRLSWRLVFALLAVVALVAALSAMSGRAAPTARGVVSLAAGAPGEKVAGGIGVPLLVLGTLLLFVALVSVEAAAGAWSYTFLTGPRGLHATTAGLLTAGFWAGLTGGRLGLALLDEEVASRRLLHGSAALTLLGCGMLWANPAGLGGAGLPVLGLGLAALFPVLIGLTPVRLGAERTATVIGWTIAAATVGGLGFTWVVGQVVERRGLTTFPLLLTGAAGVFALLHISLDRLATALRRSAPAAP